MDSWKANPASNRYLAQIWAKHGYGYGPGPYARAGPASVCTLARMPCIDTGPGPVYGAMPYLALANGSMPAPGQCWQTDLGQSWQTIFLPKIWKLQKSTNYNIAYMFSHHSLTIFSVYINASYWLNTKLQLMGECIYVNRERTVRKWWENTQTML